MADEIVSTPYDSAKALVGPQLPPWLNAYDAARLASYALYEDIYWTRSETFKLLMRGESEVPAIYLPTGRIICNTMNRYVCRNFDIHVESESDESSKLARDTFNALFKRERFRPKFNSNKLYGIIRGDACWYITADPDKPEGSRIKINTIHPGSIFWIDDPEDPAKMMGVDIIEQLVNGEDLFIKRQRYLKSEHPNHPSGSLTPGGYISYQVDSFSVEDWEDPEKRKKYNAGPNVPAETLPGITQLPVYAWKNFEEPDNPWGSSEMRGIERLFAGMNQSITDEDAALALQGLGLYWTDSGAPIDEDGNDTAWQLGPGRVVEVGAGKKFGRVSGVDSVEPSLKHVEFIQDQAFRVQGASDVAQGRVDVQMAESGIALQLRMGPILDEAQIKQDLIKGTTDQLLHDLKMWLQVYEGINLDEVMVESKFDAPLPENKAARIKILFDGYNAMPPLWSGGYVRDEMRKMGWEIPEGEIEAIAQEQAALEAVADQVGSRLALEADEE